MTKFDEEEYRRLATKVIYSSFKGAEDLARQRERELLGAKPMRLSDPDTSRIDPGSEAVAV